MNAGREEVRKVCAQRMAGSNQLPLKRDEGVAQGWAEESDLFLQPEDRLLLIRNVVICDGVAH